MKFSKVTPRSDLRCFGAGKSVFLNTILLSHLSYSDIEHLYICDAKNSDLASLKNLGIKNAASEATEIAALTEKVVDITNGNNYRKLYGHLHGVYLSKVWG